ncbi:hypothetical protein [Tahibacter amnicola]|uniref:CpeT/CpcT family protein DUF1001 n=1 Tax=Tahibacter amnicola TaxID=2976241 RepID=A0ABY6BIU0_9GAMM|nr:hypothetical protein [Tahibacter amnicola]UXI67767.1 hypothetical protein N4264_24040 [Tahibacter amnicola]
MQPDRLLAFVVAVLGAHGSDATAGGVLDQQQWRHFVLAESPDHAPFAVSASERAVPMLRETLRSRVLDVEVRLVDSPDGSRSADSGITHRFPVYTDGARMRRLSRNCGDVGLTSAVVHNGAMYFVDCNGSGVVRCELGRLSRRGARLVLERSEPLAGLDGPASPAVRYFVRRDGDDLVIETGRYQAFKQWTYAEPNRSVAGIALITLPH